MQLNYFYYNTYLHHFTFDFSTYKLTKFTKEINYFFYIHNCQIKTIFIFFFIKIKKIKKYIFPFFFKSTTDKMNEKSI